MTRTYKYGETIELYALLDQAAHGGPAVRLGPKGARAILREIDHLRTENKELAERLTRAWMEAVSD